MPENAKPASLNNIAFDTGVLMERQRIIKLLENNYWHDIYYPPQERYATKPTDELVIAHREYCIGCQLVALIKGETS